MNNYYLQCCDCGCPYAEIATNDQQHVESPELECPECGLRATLADLKMLAADLQRDQPCPIRRLEAEQQIQKLFPQQKKRESSLEARLR